MIFLFLAKVKKLLYICKRNFLQKYFDMRSFFTTFAH